MQVTQALLDQWSQSFNAVGISTHLLKCALETAPDNVDINRLLQICKTAHETNVKDINEPWALAFMSGHLGWVKTQLQQLSGSVRDDSRRNFAHFAALSGDSDCLFTVLGKYPALKDETNIHDGTITHYAALSGNNECLFDLFNQFPELKITKVNEFGGNLAHYLAARHPANLPAFLEKFPEYKNTKDNDDNTIAHYAANSGSVKNITCFLEKFPELINSKNIFGSTMAHFAAYSGNEDALVFILQKHPELNIKNDDGFTVEDRATKKGINYASALKRATISRITDTIASISPGWEKALIELKKSYANDPEINVQYLKFETHHIARLERQFKSKSSEHALKSLRILAEGGVVKASALVTLIDGQLALQEAKRLRALPESNTALFGQLINTQRKNDIIAQLSKAIRLGISSAYFELGSYYESQTETEKGFHQFYLGAKLGEKQSQSALKIASFDTVSEKVFFGNLYQGLYLQSSHYLELAQQANEKQFEVFSLAHLQDEEIALQWRLKMLGLSITKSSQIDLLIEKLNSFVVTELQKINDALARIQFAELVRQASTDKHFAQLALSVADDGKAPLPMRISLLLVASGMQLSVGDRQAIESHLEVMPNELKAEHEKHLRKPVASSSSSASSTSSEATLSHLTKENICLLVQQGIQKLKEMKLPNEQIRAVLKWIKQYPHDETKYDVHVTANEMRALLHTAKCELLFYAGAPNQMSQSIQSELQKSMALKVFYEAIDHEITGLIVEPIIAPPVASAPADEERAFPIVPRELSAVEQSLLFLPAVPVAPLVEQLEKGLVAELS